MTQGRAVVVGLARSGLALVRALHADGYAVLAVDHADTPELRERTTSLPPDVEVRLGGYAEDVSAGAVMISPSPGVPWDAPELKYARQIGVPVRSEIDLFFERCDAPIVGITGTNGKTTTTALVAAMLRAAGRRVHMGGNVGTPLLDKLEGVQPEDWVVLELSSFQLETVAEPRCSIAAVLNVTPDHLDRHGSFAAYAAIKARLIRHAAACAVLGYDDAVTRDMAPLASCPVRYFGWTVGSEEGTTVAHDAVLSREDSNVVEVMPVADIPLFGAHNVLNVLAATAMSRAASVAVEDIRRAVKAFQAVPHRLQAVLEADGILWVNDSKATNAESAVMALQAFAGRPIVWIGGGKRTDLLDAALLDAVAAHARYAVLNGDTRDELDAALAARNFTARSVVQTLAEAVEVAQSVAQPGDVVLLAPGFKSFDQFRDFEHRGETFTSLLQDMLSARTSR